MTKTRRVSLNNRAVVLKTNLFNVKQSSTKDKKSVACSPERMKGTKPSSQKSK